MQIGSLVAPARASGLVTNSILQVLLPTINSHEYAVFDAILLSEISFSLISQLPGYVQLPSIRYRQLVISCALCRKFHSCLQRRCRRHSGSSQRQRAGGNLCFTQHYVCSLFQTPAVFNVTHSAFWSCLRTSSPQLVSPSCSFMSCLKKNTRGIRILESIRRRWADCLHCALTMASISVPRTLAVSQRLRYTHYEPNKKKPNLERLLRGPVAAFAAAAFFGSGFKCGRFQEI
jgi:hypothetical protein